MPITIAELQTLLIVDDSQFNQKLDLANRKLTNFGSAAGRAVPLRIDSAAADTAIRRLRTEWEALRRSMQNGVAPVVRPPGGGGVGRPGLSAGDRMHADGMRQMQHGAVMTAAFAAPILAIGVAAARTGIGWESAFAGVTKTVNGTKEELALLEGQLRSMAAGKNPIPIDATELGKIAQTAGQLGIKIPMIAGFTRVIADLGVATNLTSETGSIQLARFANITRMSQRDFDRLGSTVVDLGNNFATTEKEIVGMALRIAGTGTLVGLSQAQILGYATALSSLGIRAEAGGSSISTVFGLLDKFTRKGGKELELLGKLTGQTGAQFKKAFEEDAAAATAQVAKGLAGLSKSGGNVIGTLSQLQMGGIRVKASMLALGNNTNVLTSALSRSERAWQENIALTKEAEKRYATTASQLKIFQNRLREQGIEISARLLPIINKLCASMGDTLPLAIRSSTEAFDAMPGAAQKTVIGMMALLALAGPTAFLAGQVRLLAGAFTVMWAAAMANPVVAVAGLAALAAGYVVLGKTFENISKAQNEVKVTTSELNASLERMLAVLPDGSKYAAQIKKIRTEIGAAGTDVEKLDQAARDLDKVKASINVNVKNPDLKLVMSDEVTQAQALLDRQKLSVTVVVQSVYKNALDTIGITNPGRPIHEISDGHGGKSIDNNLIDWTMGWGWNGDAENGLSRDPAMDYEAAEARKRGSEHAKRLKAQAAQSKAQAALAARNFIGPMPLALNPIGPPTLDQKVGALEAARIRLAAAKPKTPTKPVRSLPAFGGAAGAAGEADEKAEKKAERARDAAQRKAEAALERWRSKQAQLAEASAKPWEHLSETISGLSSRLSDFDQKTEAARLRAQMLRGAFEGIPEPIQQATLAMAQLLEKTEELGAQRDALREGNAGMLSELIRSGADTKAFLASIKAQEKAYDFGGRIDGARSKAQRIGNSLGPLAQAEAQERLQRAESLREQNDPSSYGDAPPGSGSAPQWLLAMEAASNKGAASDFGRNCAMELSARLKGAGFKFGSMSGASQDPSMRVGFDKSGRLPSGAVVRYSPGNGGYGRGHYMAVGSDQETWTESNFAKKGTAGENDVTSGRRAIQWEKLRRDVAAGRAFAFAPRGALNVPSAPVETPKETATKQVKPSGALGNKTAPKPRKEAPLAGADGEVLPFTESQFNALLKAWGPTLTDSGVRPGESRENRLAAQDRLFSRLAQGEKVTPAQARADRKVANDADFAKARTDATNAAVAASNAFNKTEAEKAKVLAESRAALDASGGSIAAYERAAFMAQKRIEIWNSAEVQALWNQKRIREANAFAADQLQKAGNGYDAQKADESHSRAVAGTKEQARETALLNAQRGYLAQSAGQPEAAIARGLENIARHRAEVNRLIDEGKTEVEAIRLANQFMAGEKVNDSLRNRIELEKRLGAQKQETDDLFAGLRDDDRRLDSNLNRGEREREKAGDDAERAKRRELAGAVKTGTMSQHEADEQVRDAGEDATAAYDWEAGNRKKGGDRDSGEEHTARMAALDARRRKIIGLDSGSPELQIQLQLLERRNELEAQNAQLVAGEKIDVDKRVDQYEAQIRAEDELSRLTQSRQNLSGAVEQTLQLQKEHELAMVHSAAERLAIEQKYQNLLNERRGVEVSPEEEAEQAKQRDQTTENEQLERGKAAAERMRDLMSSSMEEGARSGVAGMVKHWINGIKEMGQKAAFERISTVLTNKIFGANLAVDEDGPLGGMGRGRGEGARQEQQSQGSEAPATPSFIGEVRKNQAFLPFQIAPEIDLAPFSPLKKRGVMDAMKGGKEGEIPSATIYIQNATEHIEHSTQHHKNATIYAPDAATKESSGGAGSSPSNDQKVGAALAFFSR